MSYEKLTPKRFAADLEAGKYTNLGGARRAISRAEGWSESEIEKARAAAEKALAGTAKPAVAKPAKPAKKAVVKAVKVAKAPAEKKTPGRRGRKPGKVAQAATQQTATSRDLFAQAQQSVMIMSVLNQTVETLTQAKVRCPNDVDISEVQATINKITQIAETIRVPGAEADSVAATHDAHGLHVHAVGLNGTSTLEASAD